MYSTDDMLERKKQLQELPIPTAEDILELTRFGGVKVNGIIVEDENKDFSIEAVYVFRGMSFDYRGCYASNNGVTAAYLSDGQVWAFFATDSEVVRRQRAMLISRLCPIHSANVPFSNGGQQQLVELIVASGYTDGMISLYIERAGLDHLREQNARNEQALYH